MQVTVISTGDTELKSQTICLALLELINKQGREVNNQIIPQINTKLQLKKRYPAQVQRHIRTEFIIREVRKGCP